MRLRDKVAVVTGGATGIGEGITEAFAAEGARVVIASRNAEVGDAVADRVGVAYIQTDISKVASIDDLVSEVVARFGKIDVLVNNAGLIGYRNAFLKATEEEFDMVVDVNLRGTFFMSQRVARVMVEQQSGSIIHISSNISMMAEDDSAHYMASKGGINSLTLAMAKELGPYSLRVNAIAPGEILVEAAREFYESETSKQRIGNLPLRRIGLPRDVAGLAVFLASDESSYLTGTIIPVDGGQLAV